MQTLQVVATFSIVARDPVAEAVGVAVASRFLAVGAVVPWARAGAGAVATQALANTGYGPRGLELLAQGLPAEAVVRQLTAADPGREARQLGVVDLGGGAATYTGAACAAWAGGITGVDFAAQGNLLAGPEVLAAMGDSFAASRGSTNLAARLLTALAAGEAAGGDARGRQSAALYVAREGGGYGGFSDRLVDLRVDDHPEPVRELARLLGLWRLYFEPGRAGTAVPVVGAVRAEIARALYALGYLSAVSTGEQLGGALRRFIRTENCEERELPGEQIDPEVLRFLLQKAARA